MNDYHCEELLKDAEYKLNNNINHPTTGKYLASVKLIKKNLKEVKNGNLKISEKMEKRFKKVDELTDNTTFLPKS